MPQTFSTIPFIHKKTFNPIDSVPLAALLEGPVAVAKLSDLVISYSLLQAGNHVSKCARIFAKLCLL